MVEAAAHDLLALGAPRGADEGRPPAGRCGGRPAGSARRAVAAAHRAAHCQPQTHGTGCTLSSAIAAQLALGLELPDAVAAAQAYVQAALQSGAAVHTGGGNGPLNHGRRAATDAVAAAAGRWRQVGPRRATAAAASDATAGAAAMSDAATIGIAGAGLLGRLLAFRLVEAGHRVYRVRPGARRRRAAAGPRARRRLDRGRHAEPDRRARIGRSAHRRARAALDRAVGRVGAAPGVAGRLPPRRQPAAGAPRRRRQRHSACWHVLRFEGAGTQAPQPLSAAATARARTVAARAGPCLAAAGRGADRQPQAMLALADAATRRGVQWRWGRAVHERRARAGCDRAALRPGLRCARLGARAELPLRGVRGEILWLHAPGWR